VNGKKRTPRIVDGINVKRRNSLERAKQIKGEALSLLLASNANVPVERRVTPKAAYEVVWRSLNSTRYEDFKDRREFALNELDKFLRGAHGDLTLAAESPHRDLFSVSHPLSLSLKRFAVSENSIVSSRISWLSADSTFNDSLRPLVASALGSEQTSPEYVYAVSAIVQGALRHGMMNIGWRPTIQETEKTRKLEVHFFDFTADIYEAYIALSLHTRVRSEQKFENLTALKAQLQQDESTVRAYFIAQ
jgi:hypothetical protein